MFNEDGASRVSDVIFLEGIIVSVRIGCSERERSRPQPVRIDVWMHSDLKAAGGSDKLKDTLDYVKAYRILEGMANERSFVLLERFCHLCAREILKLGADSVRIRASKERCPIPGMQGRVGVEIERAKDDFD